MDNKEFADWCAERGGTLTLFPGGTRLLLCGLGDLLDLNGDERIGLDRFVRELWEKRKARFS